MKTRNRCNVELTYSDTNSHGLIFSNKDISFEYCFTKEEVDELLSEIIAYTQTNREWKEE